ncbi:MAG: NADH-quinone oxidoreductase subunit C [Chloroflexota bacterium]
MTRIVALDTAQVVCQLEAAVPGAVVDYTPEYIRIRLERLVETAHFLKTAQGLEFNYLVSITAVDYYPYYFELVYHLVSMPHHHSLVLKTRTPDRERVVVPSLVGVWRSAELQELEIYDLMGLIFAGHPELRRIFLWEDFRGHPLRKDYVEELIPLPLPAEPAEPLG